MFSFLSNYRLLPWTDCIFENIAVLRGETTRRVGNKWRDASMTGRVIDLRTWRVACAFNCGHLLRTLNLSGFSSFPSILPSVADCPFSAKLPRATVRCGQRSHLPLDLVKSQLAACICVAPSSSLLQQVARIFSQSFIILKMTTTYNRNKAHKIDSFTNTFYWFICSFFVEHLNIHEGVPKHSYF